MANFYTTLPAEEIAQQVADLLNTHNKLQKKHSAYTIMASAATYFVDVVGGKVVACSALLRESKEVSRLFHLCVHPDYRGRGIARKIKEQVLRHVESPYVYVTIREDNVVSIHLNKSMGFVEVKREWVGDHNVLTLSRLTNVRPEPTNLVNEKRRMAEGVSHDGLFYTGYRNKQGGN